MKAIHNQSSLLAVLSFLLLPCLLSAQKDHFKAYLKAPAHVNPTRLRGNKLVLGNNGKDLYIVGELKAADPDFRNYALALHTDAEGDVLNTFTLKNNFQSAVDGVRGASLAIDRKQNIYIGGSMTGSWNPLGAGAERTLTSLDVSGKKNWSAMQSNFYYADLAYDSQSDQILALSGPKNIANPQYNIEFSQFLPDGKVGKTFSLQTNSQDFASAILSLPSGVSFSGTSYLAGRARVLIAYTDLDLKLNWAFTFSHNDLELEVRDMAYHPEGLLAVSGTAENLKNGDYEAFLLGIGLDGEVYFFRTVEISQGTYNEGLGVSSYSHKGENGFLLTGFFHEGNPNERKSMILKTDLEGQFLWANQYSPFKPEDNTYDEVLRDIIYLDNEGLFAAIGDVRRYKNGQQIDKKALVLIKGRISDGTLNQGEDCYKTLSYQSHAKSLQKEEINTSSINTDRAFGFNYQQPQVEFNTGYCSFGPAGKTDENPSGRISFSPEINLNLDQFKVFKTDFNSFRLQHADKLSVNSLISVEVIDLRGQRLYETRLDPGKQRWDVQLPSISQGMYFIQIKSHNSPVQIERFIFGQ